LIGEEVSLIESWIRNLKSSLITPVTGVDLPVEVFIRLYFPKVGLKDPPGYLFPVTVILIAIKLN
jgi:hypothetical protein